jgi:subfamily B ATP-binding cassette protein MsbA
LELSQIHGSASSSRKHGEVYALGAICVIIIVSIFFKNLFTYLSFRVLAPMRNYVMTKLRSDLYAKILELPIGFFTEQRKGDIISRMSNDANEVEWSVMSTLEGLIRDPLNILIILVSLVYLSPALSLFLLGIASFNRIYYRTGEPFLKKTIHCFAGTTGHIDVDTG